MLFEYCVNKMLQFCSLQDIGTRNIYLNTYKKYIIRDKKKIIIIRLLLFGADVLEKNILCKSQWTMEFIWALDR